MIYSAGFGIQQSSKTRDIGYRDEQAPTVVVGAIHGVVLVIGEHNDLSESDRPSDGEQSSRELLRTGRL